MNVKNIEFYFDVGSPASYLAYTQLPALAHRTGSMIIWKPMLLGGVFKATGNQSPAAIPAKAAYSRVDLSRSASGYGVPLVFNPYFPINTMTLMRGAVVYLDTPEFDVYLDTVFTAMWVDQLNLGEWSVLQRCLTDAGFDIDDFLQRCEDSDIKNRLRALTDEAVARGVFGAPSFFVGKEMFFGQDRMQQLEDHLNAIL